MKAIRVSVQTQFAAHALVLFLALSFTSASAYAQRASVATERPPHFVGEPMLVRVTVEGFEEDPQPECKVESASDGLTYRLAGVSPSVSESIQIINGQFSRTKKVVFQFNFHVSAEKEGDFSFGPFTVTQGNKSAEAGKVDLSFQTIEIDPDVYIDIDVPKTAVYPGQHIPVKIRWGYAGDVESARQLRIRSPLFDQFSFEDEPVARGEIALPIATNQGTVRLKATATEETIKGKTYTVFTATRTLIPDQSGTIQFPAPSVTMRKVTRWARDFFGRRSPAAAVPVRAVGKPFELLVKPLPLDSRPQSFAGAVGVGYSMEVNADRTVVRVGDPIPLTIKIRGGGNLENAGLPSLSADGGMAPERFRLPEGDSTGIFKNGVKTFEVNVRVLDENVSEIPALAYSWFNPNTESYETTHSQPIALRVHPAQVVSASDVISANPKSTDRPSDRETASRDPQSTTRSASKPDFTLSGADLGIESDADAVLVDQRNQFSATVVQTTLYGLGLAMVVFAVWDRRRADIDPAITHRRKVLREQKHRVEQAKNQENRQAAEQIAEALRVVLAEIPDADRDEIQLVLSQCENVIFSPESQTKQSLDQSVVERALNVLNSSLKAA